MFAQVYSKMPEVDLISIVIATYNRSDALLRVLQALSVQDDKNFEIIVADDGSTQAHQDSIRTAVSSYCIALTHVWHPDIGFTLARVRNLGVAAAKGDYLIFLDGDCVPEKDFVRRHRALQELGCLVIGSRVILSQRLTQDVVSKDLQIFGRSAAFWIFKRLTGDANKFGPLLRLPDFAFRRRSHFRWKGIRGCNIAVWRKDYESVNGFDESFVGWGHEDADFVLRLHNVGIVRKNGFYSTEVYHLWHKEAKRDAATSNAEIVRARLLSHQAQATIGYRESKGTQDVVIRRWG